MDQETKEKGVLKAILQGQTDKMPQGPAPAAPTSQTGGPPQAPPVNDQNRDHQDPPECNGTTNGSTRVQLQMAKAQELLKQRRRHQNLTLELWQVQVLLLSLLIH